MNFKAMLSLILFVSLMLFISACASTGDASTPINNNNQSSSENKKEIYTISSIQTNVDFEKDFGNWCMSTWETENNGELGFTSFALSTDQKASGASSVAITCDMKGSNGISKTTKGAFKINFEKPIDLKGKLLSAKVYLPEELFEEQFRSASFGAVLYIKTTESYMWSDGGWNDIANSLQPGWNELSYAPIGVKESDTREIGIMIGKGEGAPDWSGTIYIDDISY